MLIIFTVNDQRVTHDLKQTLVSDSVGVVKAAFTFDSSWDDLQKVIVFTNSQCQKPCPVKYEGEAFDIPVQALHPGKLYVSVVGFGDGKRKTTQAWDIQQAITVQKCGAMGGCDLLRGMVEEKKVSEDDVASDAEFKDMLDEVFGPETPPGPVVDEKYVATDEEVFDMLEEVFGKQSGDGPARQDT